MLMLGKLQKLKAHLLCTRQWIAFLRLKKTATPS